MWVTAVAAATALVVALGGVAATGPASAAGHTPPRAGTSGDVGATARDVVVLPVDGPLVRLFDRPAHRYGRGHRGVDLAAWPGTPVRAALPGTVVFSGVVAGEGWVTVDHGGGLETTYGVLDPRRVVAGRRVAAGDPLGRVAPGRAHVDWGARRNGGYIDPLTLLGPWQVHLTAPRGVAGRLRPPPYAT